MSDDWFRLSTTEFFLMWWAADLGMPPPILGLPHVGRTRPERVELAREASIGLAERGLGTVDRPADELIGSMHVLHGAELVLSLYADWRGQHRRAVLASGPAGTAIAVVSGTDAYLRPTRPTGLVPTLLENLEPIPAGPGQAASVRTGDFERACAEGETGGTEAFLDVLHDAGVRPPEARTVLRAVVGREADGQVEIGRRRRDGTALPAVDGVRWIDTAEGRYAVRQRGDWLSLVPADVPKLAVLLDESLAAS